MQRRTFVRTTALGCLGLVAAPLLSACHDHPTDPSVLSEIDFSTSNGALNMVLATMQLQADFYTRVIGSPYVGMTVNEMSAISTVYVGKNALFKAFTSIIISKQLTSVLLFDFLAVDLSSRDSVFGTARTLEELGVQGVNGVLAMTDDPGAAACLVKVASVLSRHAATVRLLADVQSGSATQFDHGVTASGIEPVLTPEEWYAAADPYVRTTLSLRGL
jgi:hypothetical protein